MRPILVLLLVVGAVAAFLFAINVGEQPGSTVPQVGGQSPAEAPVQDEQDEEELVSVNQSGSRELNETAPVNTRVEAPTAAGEENVIRGRVESAAGDRLSDVRVTLSPHDPFTLFGGASGQSEVRTTTTNGKGEFVFSKVKPFEDYSLVAADPRHGRRQEAPIRISSESALDVVLVMQTGARLHGLITDSGGNVVPDAELRLGLASLGSVEQDPNMVSTRSGADGSYEFKNVPESNFTLDVSAAGYGRMLLQQINISGKGDHEQDIILDIAHMIEGRVSDIIGAPVENALVQAWSAGARDRQTRSQVKTDAEGRFLLDDVRSGVYTLFVSADGFKNERKMRVETGDLGVQVQLTPLPRVRGRVVDSGGAPVSSFKVNLRVPVQNTDDTIALRETTLEVSGATNGEFELPCPNQGEYVVEAQGSDAYAPSFSERFSVANGGEVSGLVITLSMGGSITGRIVDFQGNPVAGASIQTHDSEYVDDAFFRSIGQFPSAATEKSVQTGSDGTFKVSGLTPETYQLDIRHKEHAQYVHLNIKVNDGADTDVGSLQLSAGAVVAGTVLGPGGDPLSGAVVQLRGTGDEPHNYPTRTDATGRYSVDHVTPGSYVIYAQRPGDPNNPFLGATDMKRTKRNLVVSEGQEYSVDFTITN